MLITQCWLADCAYDADHTCDADDCLQVSRPVARLRRSRFIPSAAYQDHTQLRFGRQVTIVIFMATMMIMMILRSINMAIMTNDPSSPSCRWWTIFICASLSKTWAGMDSTRQLLLSEFEIEQTDSWFLDLV